MIVAKARMAGIIGNSAVYMPEKYWYPPPNSFMTITGNTTKWVGSPKIIPTIMNQRMKFPKGCRSHKLNAPNTHTTGPINAIRKVNSRPGHCVPVIDAMALLNEVSDSSPT